MKVAYFDCFSGAGGDMIVGALLDAGTDTEAFHRGLASLGLDGYSLSVESVKKQGFAATRFHVQLDRSAVQPSRHLSDIVAILDRAPLADRVRHQAIRVFERLAQAEARVHGCAVEKVHFHEVGAVDAILDVVGTVLALDLLGVDRIACSPLPTGSGTVECDHGVMPVPAPATAELLKGVPIVPSGDTGELLTPTAAALLTTLADTLGNFPTMTLEQVGYGAGTRETQSRPNLLRVLIGQSDPSGDTDEISVLETNLDDASGELLGRCMGRLFQEGALDVYTVPIQMKKSRPGVLLTVLCDHNRCSALEQVLFAETTTFGIRRHSVGRVKLKRRHEVVATPFGDVRIKVGQRGDIVTGSPEYEDCKDLAEKHRVALREVLASASAAWTARRNG